MTLPREWHEWGNGFTCPDCSGRMEPEGRKVEHVAADVVWFIGVRCFVCSITAHTVNEDDEAARVRAEMQDEARNDDRRAGL